MLIVWGDLLAVLIVQAGVVIWGEERHAPVGSGLQLVTATSIFTVFSLGFLWLFGAYRIVEIRRPEQELERTVKAFASVFLLFCVSGIVEPYEARHSVTAVAVETAWALVLVLMARSTIRVILSAVWKTGRERQTAIYVGSPPGLSGFLQHLTLQRFAGIDVLGAIFLEGESPSEEQTAERLMALGRIEAWRGVLERFRPDSVVVDLAVFSAKSEVLQGIIDSCSCTGIDVEVHSALVDRMADLEIDHCAGCLQIRQKAGWSMQVQAVCKILLDRAIGLAGSLVTLCLIPVLWLMLKLEDGGPLFYRQEFVGADMQVHRYLKFRTMVQNADKVLAENVELKRRFAEKHKLEDDPRVLHCGRFLRKFSIDEFPEFFSVLSGQLSFVGPRTISVAEKERYGPYLDKLLSVKSGLTGYWQVMGRQTTSYNERIQMDMFYIDRWSIWLDLVIIAKTFAKFCVPEGAY